MIALRSSDSAAFSAKANKRSTGTREVFAAGVRDCNCMADIISSRS